VTSGGRRLRVLVVGDSEADFSSLVDHLVAAGYEVAAEHTSDRGALATALGRSWDLVITDWTGRLTGLDTLQAIADHQPDTPCIVFAPADATDIVAAIRAGAADFIAADAPGGLGAAVERASAFAAERRARVVAERELRLSEERYRAGFEVAPEALLTYDYVHHRILEVNPAALALFGYSLDEMRAIEPGGLSAPTQGGRPADVAIADVMGSARTTGGTVGPFDWLYRGKSGEDLPCEVRMVPLPTADRHLTRMSIVDLRPRQRVDELRRRAAELETQNRRIEEANRLKSEFLANMSHELRTPLNAIIGFAELLHDGRVEPASTQHREFLGDILASGRHLLQLINDVLDLTKVEAGKLELRPEPVDAGQIVREVVAVQRTAAAAKQLHVAVAVDAEVGVVHVDPGRLKQVAFNFISNAIKFTPDGGSITVQVTVDPDVPERFRLAVSDTGAGIATTDHARLFVEFEQLESGANKRHQGTGLGLALVKRLVEAQGGSVGVASAIGRGSTFHATLPRHAEAVQAAVDGPTVLIVAADAADRDALARALAAAGFAIDEAGTGADAIAWTRMRGFDAIAIASGLTDTTVVDVVAALRRRPATRDVPVIVVGEAAAELDRYAVHDVLARPVDAAALTASLARAGVVPDQPGGVLVVDDDVSALRLMDAALAQQGIVSITRSTGAGGLEAAARLHPSAIVVDLVMPGMDGAEFLIHLRRLPAHAHTPVVVWTVKDLDAAERERLGRSAQRIVTKGDSPLGVVHQLQALLGGA
jgi:PAS domain S-box-containing protein